MTPTVVRYGGFSRVDFAVAAQDPIVIPTNQGVAGDVTSPKADAMWRIALAVAKEIEGSRSAGEDWMCHEAIVEFGGLTALDLIEIGQGNQVIGFLMDVLVGLRG